VVKYADGTLVRVPVMYGDMDRQAATIINNNSENKVLGPPRIAIYITDLELDRGRLADSSYVGKLHIRERAIDEFGQYTSEQGDNYTVERLMPTPYKLTLKADIWSANTDQKLQILEQILMLFNPSLEIQTTDNYIDWTSLSVVDITDVTFTSRSIPTGTNTDIDVASIGLETPIWISPPVKVKRLGVVTNIIANILGGVGTTNPGYIDGLGVDPLTGTTSPTDPITHQGISIGNFNIEVSEGKIRLVSHENNAGGYLSWSMLIDQYPNGKGYTPGLSKIYLRQPNGSVVVGYVTVNPLDNTMLIVNWDEDTYPLNSLIPSNYRTSQGTFDAVIDPHKTGPGHGLPAPSTGTRYLILDNIGGGIIDTFVNDSRIQRINTNTLHRKVNDHRVFVDGVEVGSGSLRIPNDPNTGNYFIVLDQIAPAGSEITYELYMNEDGPDAWKNDDGSDFIAGANDIIEWNGSAWTIVFSAKESADRLIYLTNEYTSTQYLWNGVAWVKSFEGDYQRGDWYFEP
jgi:hypothetical protein